MRCHKSLVVAAALVAGALASCGGDRGAPAAASDAGTAAPHAQDAAEPASGPGASFALEVEGGPWAGRYEETSDDPHPCNIGMLSEGGFSAQVVGEPIAYLDLHVPDFAQLDGQADVFGLNVKFKAGPKADLHIDNQPVAFAPGGSGRVTWTDRGGDDIEVQVEGTSAEGPHLSLRVDCNRVARTAGT